MSIRVTDFKWEKGKNDLEYIALLEKNLDVMMYKFRECSKIAKEQYSKGRADERSHIVGILFGIDRQVAELVKEILNNEKTNK